MVRKYRFILFFSMLWQSVCLAQLVVNTGNTPQQLVQNVLIGGGVTVSNVQFTGASGAAGFFDGQNSNIGLSSGVLLTTGLASGAIGPNNLINDSGTDHTMPGDAALTAISGSTFGTYDACILEFDFVPQSDSLSFRYVFASNEYMLYVGSDVNDVFAFFISGPGFVGEENIALIQGTTTPVSIDNVNANTNSQFYINNGDSPAGPMGQTIEYNGFTTVLTARAQVQACQTYHIRLAIADGGDGVYDSGVFLEAGSFSTPVLEIVGTPSFSLSQTQNQLVEGCSNITITFNRSGDLSQALTVPVTISGNATPGQDCSPIPGSVTFMEGQNTVNITINILQDGVPEGIETLTVGLSNVNPCVGSPPPSITFTIEDHPGLSVSASPDTTLFCPATLTINTQATGGIGNLAYSWQGNFSNTAQITVSPTQSTTYTVTVTDQCGVSATDAATINMGNYMPMNLTATNAVACQGNEVALTANATGGAGAISYTWGNGLSSGPTFTFRPNTDQIIEVMATDSCGISVSTNAYVTVTVATAQAEYSHISNNTIAFSAIVDFGASAVWDFGDGTTSEGILVEHSYLDTGRFDVILMVIDANGCETNLPLEVISYPELRYWVPSAFTPNGDGQNDLFRPVGEGFLNWDLLIYNRWGEILYETYGTRRGWNGWYDNRPVPPGNYAYKLVMNLPAGKPEERLGGVILIR